MREYVRIEEVNVAEMELRPHQLEELERVLNLRDEISMYHAAEVVVLMDSGTYDWPDVRLVHDVPIAVRYNAHEKRYRFVNLRRFNRINRSQESHAIRDIVQPQKIGKLTERKVMDWVRYVELCDIALCEREAEAIAFEANYRAQLEATGVEVFWYDGNRRGVMTRGGISFDFELEYGYVSAKLTVQGRNESSIERFMELSDNGIHRAEKGTRKGVATSADVFVI